MLELINLTKDYVTSSEIVNALRGVDIKFRDKEFVSVLGPSGCGKTTMLNIIGGLDRYTSGDLVINGRSTKSYKDRDWDVYRNHRVGFIFQSYNLIPHQTVLGNVELALTIAGIEREERVARAKAALDKVGLSNQYYKRPNQLSGGQCQRVAIARALVNDPEILLADEPTGALDTVTSVQIMELIREIAGERLVIMVTHNPELAEQYSTRIVRLLDGNIIEDSNPVTEEEARAAAEQLALAEEAAAENADSADSETDIAPKASKKKAKAKKEKAKMSFFTAFRLSARNLISKKGRTAMVGFAGSIGIIGIALVLAFSAGIRGYIASMQDDMLSGNPITITKTAYDLTAINGMMQNMADNLSSGDKEPGKVYVSSLIEYLVEMRRDTEDILLENNITKEYIDYIKAMPEESYKALVLGYGIDMTTNIYTDFKYDKDSEVQNISLHRLLNVAKSVLGETPIKEQADSITSLAPSMKQMPNNVDYILSQYDLVAGDKIATEKDEIMLVLDSDDELSDILLARLGYFTQEEVLEIVNKSMSETDEYNKAIYKDAFTYEELIGKSFTWYPNNTVFTEGEPPYTGMPASYQYNSTSEGFSDEGKVELKIVGILTPKETVSYGSLSSGIYYTEALTNHVLEVNSNSNFEDYLRSEASASLAMTAYNLYYNYTYTYDSGDGDLTPKTAQAMIGPELSMTEMMAFYMAGDDPAKLQEVISKLDREDMINRFSRLVGGSDLATSVSIYPISFDEKNAVTDWLNKWNEEGVLEYTDRDGNTAIVSADRETITYTDTLELVINMINTMIDIVSYALIAFTSVSLVVSTVMIGIITYVSVVERIKEIGVIRSLGGRKRDVSNLFVAETFIIGLLAGLFGVGATYLISFVVNLILKPLISYPNIAALSASNALLLICLSVGLTLISGVAPARSAAKKDPVIALRTE